LGFRVWGPGLNIQDLGLRVGEILGLRVLLVGLGLRVNVSTLKPRVQGFKI
jgi:hypothetical protein